MSNQGRVGERSRELKQCAGVGCAGRGVSPAWRISLTSHKGQQKGKDLAMLITFKTRAAPDVQMLDNLADYLLGIIGKRLGERGVITHEELPECIQKLESAVATDKQERAEHDGHFHEGEPGHEPHEIPVGLAQGAYPFL